MYQCRHRVGQSIACNSLIIVPNETQKGSVIFSKSFCIYMDIKMAL